MKENVEDEMGEIRVVHTLIKPSFLLLLLWWWCWWWWNVRVLYLPGFHAHVGRP